MPRKKRIVEEPVYEMPKMKLSELKAYLEDLHDDTDPILKALENDKRKGVVRLLTACRKRLKREAERRAQFKEMQGFEKLAYIEGARFVAGIDEVGRGPLAGPVVAAAVILPHEMEDIGLDDSKKLPAAKREAIYEKIQEQAIAIGIGIVDAETIDAINIYEASKLAMQRAVSELQVQPDYLLIDAMKIDSHLPQIGIIKGDAKSVSIAAASIVAKVVRDRMMEELDVLYPGYDFAANAGYGTTRHLEGLQQLGACPIHRKTFAPVKEILTI